MKMTEKFPWVDPAQPWNYAQLLSSTGTHGYYVGMGLLHSDFISARNEISPAINILFVSFCGICHHYISVILAQNDFPLVSLLTVANVKKKIVCKLVRKLSNRELHSGTPLKDTPERLTPLYKAHALHAGGPIYTYTHLQTW